MHAELWPLLDTWFACSSTNLCHCWHDLVVLQHDQHVWCGPCAPLSIQVAIAELQRASSAAEQCRAFIIVWGMHAMPAGILNLIMLRPVPLLLEVD